MIRRGSSSFFRYLADEHIIRNNLLSTTFDRHSLNADFKTQSDFSYPNEDSKIHYLIEASWILQ
ncbi:MAG: hypothetical protein MHMPM18_002227, partial [Marteilia pararefringens]